MDDIPRYRELKVPPQAAGMRLDRFLSAWFRERSRSELARAVKDGQVRDEHERPLRPSAIVKPEQRLRLYVAGIAPADDPPPFPAILHEDARYLVVDKPAGMLAHPAGEDWAWSVVQLARARFGPEIDLVHRLDRDTSGVLLLGKDPDAVRFAKVALQERSAEKDYLAISKGSAGFSHTMLDGPIGPDDGEIRIRMAIRPDGLPALTEVWTEERRTEPEFSLIRCRLHTGRTHQIRLHLAFAGLPLLGDRMYGVPSWVFLRAWEQGVDEAVIRAAGAPRQALHAARLRIPHPDGATLEVEAPFPEDMRRWWDAPAVLPLDGWAPAPVA